MTATTSAPTPITAPDAINVKIGEYIYEVEALVRALKEKVETASGLNETELERVSHSVHRLLRESNIFRSTLASDLNYPLLASCILDPDSDTIRWMKMCIQGKINELTSSSLQALVAGAASTAISNHIDLVGQYYVDKIKDEALLNIVDREAAFKILATDGPSSRTSHESWTTLDSSKLRALRSILKMFAAQDDSRSNPEELALPWSGCYATINDDTIIVTVEQGSGQLHTVIGSGAMFPMCDVSELDVRSVSWNLFHAYRNNSRSVLLSNETWLDRFCVLTSPANAPRFVQKAIAYLRDHPDFEADYLQQAKNRLINHI